MKLRRHLCGAILAGLGSLAVLSTHAQSFTNSATLSAAVDGTNLVVNYSLTTTQGWVTLFSADRPELFPAAAQPVDIAPAPPSLTGQFRVPLTPGTPTKFYKLLIEQWPSRGKALVFIGGPLDFAAMRQTYGDITNTLGSSNSTPMIFKQPVAVWLDNLGTYDTNGVRVGGNSNMLNGKYSTTDVFSFNTPGAGYPQIGRLTAVSNNDFRVIYDGTGTVPAREAILWSSEVQLYYDVNDYRARFLNDAFVDELNLPTETANNLRNGQCRPNLRDYYDGTLATTKKPTLRAWENGASSGGISLFPLGNVMNVDLRSRGQDYLQFSPISLAYDTEASMCDYLGLVAFWVLGTNTGFPSDAFFGQTIAWQTNMLPTLNDGVSAWAAYRYSANSEVYRYADYALRIWGGRPCGGTNVPCDKGENVRNVMMFDEANTTKDGVYPFSWPANLTSDDGPTTSDLAALYVAALFYDIANESGLGVHKADLLIWKTISLITNNVYFPMRSFGATVQQAARALWPDPRPGRAGMSLYEDDILDVLTSRGIPVNGVSDFRTNLPPAIGDATSLDIVAASAFGSQHPETQPSVGVYGNYSTSRNGYTFSNTVNYVAYQFYKHSKYGPCDKLALTDGTFTANTSAPFDWVYNSNGTFYVEFTDRDLGNLVLFAPSNHIRWMRSRQRCPNEATGFYAEDVRPFGFRVIKATPNGFSFTAFALSETATNKTYHLAIVDPSVAALGAASYAWSFTNHLGSVTTASGSTATYTAVKDEPFTISIARTRNSQTDTLTLRERGNDLDRNGGQAFVRNLVP